MRIDSLTSWMRSGMSRKEGVYSTVRSIQRAGLGRGGGGCSEYLGVGWWGDVWCSRAVCLFWACTGRDISHLFSHWIFLMWDVYIKTFLSSD